jgi:hypothetical protein
VTEAELRQVLLGMAEEDRRVRAELAATGELFRGYAPRMEEVHRRNARVLESIIDRYGWPGKSLVGDDGADAAWLVLQHAVGSPQLQRRCLAVLREAVARGEMEPAHLAYLEDRICFFERRPQRYGTQFDWDERGRLSPWLLEDPERVDEYRLSVGLGPLAERLEQARRETADGAKPPDPEGRKEEMLAWAKSVGWV